MAPENISDRKPMVLVFAGPNGSGKSTIKEWFEIVGEYTNADDVVKATGMDNLAAAEWVDRMRDAAIELKADFTFETVLSSNYKLKILKKAKEKGYFIKCAFVLTTSPWLNVARVAARVAQGGHDVPSEKIIDRYYKALDNISVLMNICDILHVYDNTGDYPVRIIRKHKQYVTIFPNENWDEKRIEALLYD